MTTTPKNGDTSDQNQDGLLPNEALHPAPLASTMDQGDLDTPPLECDPEGTVGTGINPP